MVKKFVLVFLLGIIRSSICLLISPYDDYNHVSLRSLCGSSGDILNHQQTLQLDSMMNDSHTKKSAFYLYSSGHDEYRNVNSTRSFKCTFKVKAVPGEFIYAKIQSMTFNSNPNGECKDYIKFIDDYTVLPRYKLFCGKHIEIKRAMSWSRYDHYANFYDSKIIKDSRELSFDAERNELNVEIFVSSDNINNNLQNNLIVTFTPYTIKTNGWDIKYRINKIYECDGVENCNGVKCIDENNCHLKWVDIFLSMIPILLGIFAAVFIYYLWKNGDLCRYYSNRRDNNTSQTINNLPREIFLIESDNHHVSPPLDSLPSYESLFPHRSTTSSNENLKTVTNSTAEISHI